MNFLDERPFLRQALRGRLSDERTNYQNVKLKTMDSRLFYIIGGKGNIIIDGAPYKIEPDMVILFKAGTEYEYSLDEMDYYVVNFDYNYSFSNFTKGYHPMNSSFFEKNDFFDCGEIEDCPELNYPIILYRAVSMKRLIKEIVLEASILDEYSKPMRSAMLSAAIYEILRNRSASNSDRRIGREIVKEIIDYAYENLQKPLNNSEIAAFFGYNPAYIGRLFKKHTGTPLHNFVIELKIEAAKELLSANNSVAHAAESVGFSDLYHFSKLFKSKTGITPSKYKEKP